MDGPTQTTAAKREAKEAKLFNEALEIRIESWRGRYSDLEQELKKLNDHI